MWKFLTLLFLIFTLNTHGAEPEPGKFFYTVQVASFKEMSKAQEILRKLKDLPYARISYRNGRYKVRIGFFKSFSDAERFVNEKLKGKIKDYYITRIRYSPKNVFFAQFKSTVKSKPKHSNLQKKPKSTSLKNLGNSKNQKVKINNAINITSKSQDITDKTAINEELNEQILKNAQEELKKTQVIIEKNVSVNAKKQEQREDREFKNKSELKPKNSLLRGKDKLLETNKPRNIQNRLSSSRTSLKIGELLVKIGVPVLVLLALMVIFLRLKKKKGAPPKDLEELVAELLEEERCGELLEAVLPALPSQPDNTFLRKAVADCYVKLGKLLEAASIYEEIAEILNRKGLSVLSEEFRRKADELYGKEFKGRG